MALAPTHSFWPISAGAIQTQDSSAALATTPAGQKAKPHSQINSLTPWEILLSKLKKAGVVDESGWVNESLAVNFSLPPLNEFELNAITAFLKAPIRMKLKMQGNSHPIEFTPIQFFDFIEKEISQAGPLKIEFFQLIGGAIPSLIPSYYIRTLQLLYAEACIKSGAAQEELFTKEIIEDLDRIPPDFDLFTKINLGSYEILEKVNKLIPKFLASLICKDRKEIDQAATWIESHCLDDYIPIFGSLNRFALASFGSSKDKKIDHLFVNEMLCNQMFFHHGLKINISSLIGDIKKCKSPTPIIPYNDFRGGWQSIVDRSTKQIHIEDLLKANDRVWAILISCQSIGYNWNDPLYENTLLKKVRNHAATLIDRWNKHHYKDPRSLITLAFNGATSLLRQKMPHSVVEKFWCDILVEYDRRIQKLREKYEKKIKGPHPEPEHAKEILKLIPSEENDRIYLLIRKLFSRAGMDHQTISSLFIIQAFLCLNSQEGLSANTRLRFSLLSTGDNPAVQITYISSKIQHVLTVPFNITDALNYLCASGNKLAFEEIPSLLMELSPELFIGFNSTPLKNNLEQLSPNFSEVEKICIPLLLDSRPIIGQIACNLLIACSGHTHNTNSILSLFRHLPKILQGAGLPDSVKKNLLINFEQLLKQTPFSKFIEILMASLEECAFSSVDFQKEKYQAYIHSLASTQEESLSQLSLDLWKETCSLTNGQINIPFANVLLRSLLPGQPACAIKIFLEIQGSSSFTAEEEFYLFGTIAKEFQKANNILLAVNISSLVRAAQNLFKRTLPQKTSKKSKSSTNLGETFVWLVGTLASQNQIPDARSILEGSLQNRHLITTDSQTALRCIELCEKAIAHKEMGPISAAEFWKEIQKYGGLPKKMHREHRLEMLVTLNEALYNNESLLAQSLGDEFLCAIQQEIIPEQLESRIKQLVANHVEKLLSSKNSAQAKQELEGKEGKTLPEEQQIAYRLQILEMELAQNKAEESLRTLKNILDYPLDNQQRKSIASSTLRVFELLAAPCSSKRTQDWSLAQAGKLLNEPVLKAILMVDADQYLDALLKLMNSAYVLNPLDCRNMIFDLAESILNVISQFAPPALVSIKCCNASGSVVSVLAKMWMPGRPISSGLRCQIVSSHQLVLDLFRNANHFEEAFQFITAMHNYNVDSKQSQCSLNHSLWASKEKLDMGKSNPQIIEEVNQLMSSVSTPKRLASSDISKEEIEIWSILATSFLLQNNVQRAKGWMDRILKQTESGLIKLDALSDILFSWAEQCQQQNQFSMAVSILQALNRLPDTDGKRLAGAWMSLIQSLKAGDNVLCARILLENYQMLIKHLEAQPIKELGEEIVKFLLEASQESAKLSLGIKLLTALGSSQAGLWVGLYSNIEKCGDPKIKEAGYHALLNTVEANRILDGIPEARAKCWSSTIVALSSIGSPFLVEVLDKRKSLFKDFEKSRDFILAAYPALIKGCENLLIKPMPPITGGDSQIVFAQKIVELQSEFIKFISDDPTMLDYISELTLCYIKALIFSKNVDLFIDACRGLSKIITHKDLNKFHMDIASLIWDLFRESENILTDRTLMNDVFLDIISSGHQIADSLTSQGLPFFSQQLVFIHLENALKDERLSVLQIAMENFRLNAAMLEADQDLYNKAVGLVFDCIVKIAVVHSRSDAFINSLLIPFTGFQLYNPEESSGQDLFFRPSLAVRQKPEPSAETSKENAVITSSPLSMIILNHENRDRFLQYIHMLMVKCQAIEPEEEAIRNLLLMQSGECLDILLTNYTLEHKDIAERHKCSLKSGKQSNEKKLQEVFLKKYAELNEQRMKEILPYLDHFIFARPPRNPSYLLNFYKYAAYLFHLFEQWEVKKTYASKTFEFFLFLTKNIVLMPGMSASDRFDSVSSIIDKLIRHSHTLSIWHAINVLKHYSSIFRECSPDMAASLYLKLCEASKEKAKALCDGEPLFKHLIKALFACSRLAGAFPSKKWCEASAKVCVGIHGLILETHRQRSEPGVELVENLDIVNEIFIFVRESINAGAYNENYPELIDIIIKQMPVMIQNYKKLEDEKKYAAMDKMFAQFNVVIQGPPNSPRKPREVLRPIIGQLIDLGFITLDHTMRTISLGLATGCFDGAHSEYLALARSLMHQQIERFQIDGLFRVHAINMLRLIINIEKGIGIKDTDLAQRADAASEWVNMVYQYDDPRAKLIARDLIELLKSLTDVFKNFPDKLQKLEKLGQ